MSEIDIIQGLKMKNQVIHQYMYNKWYGYLFSIAIKVVKNRQDAEDIIQESFMKIFSNIDSFTIGKSFKGWMSTIVAHTAITYYNRYKKHNNHVDITGHEPLQLKTSHFLGAYIANDIYKHAMKILQQKAPSQYMFVRLYFDESMSHKEIAEDLGIPEGTSKGGVSRGCSKLRNIIKDYETINFN
jgi:RNA polymerase sigma factor (sigma-70 family)